VELKGLTQAQIQLLITRIPDLPLAEKVALLEELEQFDLASARKAARDDFLVFCHRVDPAFKEGPHHRHMRPLLQDMAGTWSGTEEIPEHALRLTVSLAPRFGKSHFVAYLYVAWYLGHNPNHQIMMVTHTAELSESFGKKVRDLIDSPVYQDIFERSVQVSKDKSAAGNWTTSQGGVYLALGVGGNAAGKGADLLIADDLCVAPGSTVITPYGPKAAGDILVGDKVLAFEGWVEVIKAVRTQHDETVTINGSQMSLGHPVWTFGRGWQYAGALNLDDVLQTTSAYDKIKASFRSLYEQTSEAVRRTQARIQHLGHDEAAVQQPQGRKLRELRSPWADRGQALGSLRAFFGGYGSGPHAQTHLGSGGQCLGVLSRELQMGGRGDAAEQQNQRRPLRAPRPDALRTAGGAACGAPDGTYDAPAKSSENDTTAGHGVPERLLGAAPRTAKEFGGLRRCAARLHRFSRKMLLSVGKDCGSVQAAALGVLEKAAALVGLLVGVCRVAAPVRSGSAELVCLSVSGSNTFYVDGMLTHNCSEQAVLYGNPAVAFETAWTYMQVGPMQRLMPGGRMVFIGTRWGKADPIAKAIQNARDKRSEGALQWHEINFPATMEVERDGEMQTVSLWPEQWPLQELLAKKAGMRPMFWSAQYMQDPTSDNVALLKREYWQIWPHEDPPEVDTIIQVWDTAHETKNRSDFSACGTFGVFFNTETNRNEMILLNAIRDRWEFPELKLRAREQAAEWKPDHLLIEKKAAGAPLIQELRRMDLFVEEYSPSRGKVGHSNDKYARVNSITPIFEDGCVWMPDTKWARDVREECADFPSGEHDDYVDVVSMACMRFRQGGYLRLSDDADDEDNEPTSPRIAAYY
jgi:predicted phage terminase large subunit-like protein